MGDTEIDIIDDTRQRVEVGAVGADQHRVRQGCCIHMLLAANEIVPHHITGLELEAPMWLATLVLEFGPVGVRELERGAVVDRRFAARELALALQLELVLRLVGRIEPAARFELLYRRVIERKAVRLLRLKRPVETEPDYVLTDSACKLLGRALAVGIVEAEQQAATTRFREHPVQQGRADIAGMNAPGRARREADGNSHARASRGTCW